MTTKTIQALLDDIRLLGEEQHSLVTLFRELVKDSISPVSEEVKYGGIIFSSGEQFCGVFAYKKHVSVEFSQGAKITDTLGYLEGKGKGRRHIKLYSIEDIKIKHLAEYLPLSLVAAKTNA
ncbi:DUF1801 domain-containing protein [Porticoccus sp. W117]|uniref:DUF1801 domain-containing protein n=1 Tax=Porticoccus sp. W117 TaxID=3054777 RepID=UPI00259855AF|nr:DUF1801 domain-containing protein [Porticoccus sp. W117]MDM3870997.1 DUF1801 domain-containing protein [Porticoccus sp. W117]